MNNIYDLPEIDFVEKDPEKIRNSIITTYEALAGKTLYPGDPIRLFLETIAAIIVQQRILIDSAAKQNTLRYAKGDYLDHIGALVGVIRGKAKKAITTLRFNISAPQLQAVPIPLGTKAAPSVNSNQIYFETIEYAEIPPGETSIDVKAQCTIEGEIGNGFLAGQINQIVTLFPYFQSVENITESSGGCDEEDDETFRQRIFEAPETFSVAGPEMAYINLARQASPLICDVTVRSPNPGVVEIIPLVKEGDTTQELLDLVYELCSAKDARPLTDNVLVQAPEKVFYDINLTYYVDKNNETMVYTIQNSINQVVNDYLKWQREKLGRNINPSELIKRIMQAGASRVGLTHPTFIRLESHQVAINNTVNIVYGGIEDE